MTCPSCNTALEPNARFCGVCGHQISAESAAVPKPASGGGPAAAGQPAAAAGNDIKATRVARPANKTGEPFNPAGKSTDPFIGQVLNNRFKIESKIGEGGF